MQSSLEELHESGVRVVAASADGPDEAARLVERLQLTFPVVHSLDVPTTVRALGCYEGTMKGSPHLQPAGFVLEPDGTVELAVYSTGRVGRLTAKDILALAGS